MADPPGHVQYTRNMVTGASTANLSIVLVDARQGVIEQSNVQAVIELTRLIQLSRDFEALQQVSSSEHARLVDVIDRIPAV